MRNKNFYTYISWFYLNNFFIYAKNLFVIKSYIAEKPFNWLHFIYFYYPLPFTKIRRWIHQHWMIAVQLRNQTSWWIQTSTSFNEVKVQRNTHDCHISLRVSFILFSYTIIFYSEIDRIWDTTEEICIQVSKVLEIGQNVNFVCF